MGVKLIIIHGIGWNYLKSPEEREFQAQVIHLSIQDMYEIQKTYMEDFLKTLFSCS